jgi:hypothetical protein
MLFPQKPRTSSSLILKYLKNWNWQLLTKSNTHTTLVVRWLFGSNWQSKWVGSAPPFNAFEIS